MGGNAFCAMLSSAAFPRLPPAVYRALKSDMLTKISEFYDCVGVPPEAPEKADYGDVDYLVTSPKAGYGSFVPHEIIKQALNARYVNAMDGNRTSNYAVPVKYGQWMDLAHGPEEIEKRSATEDGQIYYQIDVHVCLDMDEYNRILFFHSYGDLCIILTRIAADCGLSLGVKGLKLPDPPNPPFVLSMSFNEIMSFFGLSMQVFTAGFRTPEEVFKWAASSKYFDANLLRSTWPGINKVAAQRTMYFDFVKWLEVSRHSCPHPSTSSSRAEWEAIAREEALVYFNKKEEYETLSRSRFDRLRLKGTFSGSNVRDWAGLGNHWKGVKLIMDEVRQRMEGDVGILQYLEKNGEEGLKAFVIRVRDELGVLDAARK